MGIVEVNGLTKKFGKFTAIDNISLTINEGDIYGFIGPNGAGKSTTIKVLLGMLKPTKGTVSIFGKDAWKDAVEIHKKVAYVPGDVNLWPNLTGGQVIDLFLKMRGSHDPKKRDELIERFQFDPGKKCRSYSKGNRQKVALISAFASDADLFIFDEPTAGLDPLMERIFQQLVKEVSTEGKSVFLSSHILSEVEKLCQKVSIIREGKIIESGSLEEMRHLTRNNIVVQTEKEIPDLKEWKGVHHLVEENGELVFQADSEELPHLMRHISQYGIIKLECTPPTLEDLFMRHYEGKENGSLSGGARP